MKTETFDTNRSVLDPRTTSDLRQKLRDDSQAGLKEAAREFEALLLQMMLKSMRSATLQDGLLDNDQTRFFTEIYDQQLASNLSASGTLGFATMIERQLGGGAAQMSADALDTALSQFQQAFFEQRTASSAASFAARFAISSTGSTSAAASVSESGSEYAARVWPHAAEAAKTLGVPPHFLVAHSALESGWGKHEIRLPDGSSSYNVFGIKAGSGWQGPTVDVTTTEYVNGAAQTVTGTFRVYGSYGEAFQDYAKMLSGNTRYADVLGEQDGSRFARSLQQSGYATDPAYADKLSRIIGGTTLQQAMTESLRPQQSSQTAVIA